MKKEAFAFYPHSDWTLISAFIFSFLFIGLLIWIFRKGSKHHYQQIAHFPLEEDQK